MVVGVVDDIGVRHLVPDVLIPLVPKRHEQQDAKRERDREAGDDSRQQSTNPEHSAEARWSLAVGVDHSLVEQALRWCLTGTTDCCCPDQPADTQRDEHEDELEKICAEPPPGTHSLQSGTGIDRVWRDRRMVIDRAELRGRRHKRWRWRKLLTSG